MKIPKRLKQVAEMIAKNAERQTYGTAVLTVLQAQHKSIEEIGVLVQKRRLQAFLKGGKVNGWLDCFWKNIAILEAQRVNYGLSLS